MRNAIATSLLLFAGIGFSVSGCQWDVGPDRSAQGLTEEQCEDVTDLPGYPTCGERFVANVRPECNECSDPGCVWGPDGIYTDCLCHAEGELCIQQGPTPDGGPARELCDRVGESCDCGDEHGRGYQCQCEGGGDDCHCWLETDFFFDPMVECKLVDK